MANINGVNYNNQPTYQLIKEKIVTVRELDAEGRVVKETTTTDKEYAPYYPQTYTYNPSLAPSWYPNQITSDIKYGNTNTEANE